MRKLTLYIAASLDGYIAGPNGEIDWLEENYAIRLYDNSCDPNNSRGLRNRNYDLLENIIRKPSDSDIEQIKFDIINKFLGMC